MRKDTFALAGIVLVFGGLLSTLTVNACEENPGDLTISVSGAQAGSKQNYYVVQIPEEGTTSVTVKGEGQTPCPTEQEKCKCGTETTDPEKDGAPKYTFTKTIGTQDPGNGPNVKFDVAQSTATKEYKFKLTKIEQKYKACKVGWTGGVTSKSNTKASQEITVLVVKVEMKFAKVSECDGKKLDVNLLVNPTSVRTSLSNGSFTCQKPGGGTSFDNPFGSGSKMQSKGGSDYTKWEIDNVRWYSTQADHKNNTSPYEVVGTVEVHGVAVNVKKGTFTADFISAALKVCANGSAPYVKRITGTLAFNTVKQPNGRYHTTVTMGSLIRDVDATTSIRVDAKSQFYAMIVAEENFHVTQLEDPNHPLCGDSNMFIPQNILTAVQAGQPYDGPNAAFSGNSARSAFLREKTIEVDRSNALMAYPSPIRCGIEKEAKAAPTVNASHRLTYAAAYPDCP